MEPLGGQRSPKHLLSLAKTVGESPPEEAVGCAQKSGLHPGGDREPVKGSEAAAEWLLGAQQAGAPAPPGATHPIWVRLLVADCCEPSWRCCQRGQPSCQGAEPAPRPRGQCPPPPPTRLQPSASGRRDGRLPSHEAPSWTELGCPRGTCPYRRPSLVLSPSPTANTKHLPQALLLGEPNKTPGCSSKKDRSGCPSGSAGMGVWKSGCRRNDGAPCPGYPGLPHRQSSTRTHLPPGSSGTRSPPPTCTAAPGSLTPAPLTSALTTQRPDGSCSSPLRPSRGSTLLRIKSTAFLRAAGTCVTCARRTAHPESPPAAPDSPARALCTGLASLLPLPPDPPHGPFRPTQRPRSHGDHS